MKEKNSLVWFRHDLRIEDNPALYCAREHGAPVICLYVDDPDLPHAPGAASKWWLHHSLKSLTDDLEKAGSWLILRRGEASSVVKSIVEENNVGSVFWNRRYFPSHTEIDKSLKKELQDQGVEVKTFNGNLLREPWELETGSGGHYRVYSPFWRSLQKARPARTDPLPRIRKIEGPEKLPDSDALDDWELLPTKPNWADEIEESWTPGEQGARDRLNAFLRGPVEDYADGRNRPDCEYTSRLSPHLAFGEISPVSIWAETMSRIEKGDVNEKPAYKFLSEIAWREFSYNLLFHHGELPEKPLREEFANYPWRDDQEGFKAWTKGLTGYPIVDAGMRQLWRTGWMHNRVRMIAASFLIKDLLIPWQEGEAWFWDTLVDADIANNSASWQWVAGCGADAAPYFRIFNPVTQGEKFDPDGDYVREFVPEIAALPAKHIHAPWKAPEDVLETANITLGKTYPKPIIDHGEARKRALEGYEQIKSG
ncbi:MAG: deoxyribodipyrimidine photo-lyase [Pseudomonadota bacterium]